jgi:hypothetical protein
MNLTLNYQEPSQKKSLTPVCFFYKERDVFENKLYTVRLALMAKHKRSERRRELARRQRRRRKRLKLRAKGLLPPAEETKKEAGRD